ncbi:alpha/beta fold hydrolase [Nocardioides sp. NPDC051685]|uniref:alpha/beta fold hydrolase n=1 Tax=Nocardioides sp. NPDC051685 TaxID=3364334 RepID=UPI00379B57EF
MIAVDLPRFGESEALSASDDFGAYSRLLGALLDELGIGAVSLVGHSLGGLVTLSFTAVPAHRIRCLVWCPVAALSSPLCG